MRVLPGPGNSGKPYRAPRTKGHAPSARPRCPKVCSQGPRRALPEYWSHVAGPVRHVLVLGEATMATVRAGVVGAAEADAAESGVDSLGTVVGETREVTLATVDPGAAMP